MGQRASKSEVLVLDQQDRSFGARPQEDGPERQQDRSFGARPQEDGPERQQDRSFGARPQEDGPERQQERSFGARPQEDGPERRQAFDAPSGNSATDFSAKSMEFMVLMMESVRDLQKKISDGREEGSVAGVETVRSGSPDLPMLQPWTSNIGPLILGDWLLLVGPILSDLSATAHDWWNSMLAAVEGWYQVYVSLNPLDRLRHEAKAPEELRILKWQRLERRAATMLLAAVPEGCREELLSARRLDAFGILTHLHCTYSPGGVAEKQMLLRNLEEPAEITHLQDGPLALRKWLGWRRRAKEVGAIEPDPALLLKGINRMTKRLLDAHRDVSFRVSLVRSTLGVDTTPTLTSVDQLANHLLAEFEQLSQ